MRPERMLSRCRGVGPLGRKTLVWPRGQLREQKNETAGRCPSPPELPLALLTAARAGCRSQAGRWPGRGRPG